MTAQDGVKSNDPRNTRPVTTLRAMTFSALLLALIVLATWLGTLLHEAIGHCLTLQLLGGMPEGFRIDTFGGGRAWGDGPSGKFLHDFGGMLVNIATGAVALLWLYLRPPNGTLRLAIILFILISVLSQMGYACIGFYYDIGDPSGWADRVPFGGRYVWTPFLIAAPLVAYLLMKPYVRLQEQLFPIASPFRRVLFAIATLGTVIVVFGGLHIATSSLHRVDFAAHAQAQARERVRIAKTEALKEELRHEYPEADAAEIQRRVEETPIAMKPEEGHVGPWVAIAYAVLMAAGGLVALWRGTSDSVERLPLPSRRGVIASWVLVAVGLGVLWLFGNEFPWPG